MIDGLKRYGRLTQIELAGITGLSPATVSNIVKELTAAGILNTSITSRSGRRATLVSLARRLGIVAGVHFSSRHLHIAIADATRTIVSQSTLPLPVDHRHDAELDRLTLLLSDMMDSIGGRPPRTTSLWLAPPPPDAAHRPPGPAHRRPRPEPRHLWFVPRHLSPASRRHGPVTRLPDPTAQRPGPACRHLKPPHPPLRPTHRSLRPVDGHLGPMDAHLGPLNPRLGRVARRVRPVPRRLTTAARPLGTAYQRLGRLSLGSSGRRLEPAERGLRHP